MVSQAATLQTQVALKPSCGRHSAARYLRDHARRPPSTPAIAGRDTPLKPIALFLREHGSVGSMSRRGNPREGGKGQTGRGPIVPETDHKVPGTQRDFSVREQL